jgi:hypothetical protein
MSLSYKHGDVVQHMDDGRLGRVITTQDGYLNVEPEHFSSQEQWAASKVRLIEDPTDEQTEALDARIDAEQLDGSGMFKGAQPAPSGPPAPAEPVDTTVLAHPDPAMVSSGLHQSYSDLAAEAGLPDPFANPHQAVTRAREEGLRAGLMLSEVDPGFAQGYADRVEAAKRAAGEGDSADAAPAAGSGAAGEVPKRRTRKPAEA